MQQIIEFIINHWALWLAFVVVLALLLHFELSSTVAGIKLLSPQEVTTMINRENAAVIDIRDDAAFQTGHIVGALNIPVDQMDKHLKKLQRYKTKPIIISCSAGQQSPQFGAKLRKQSFSKIFALKGGISAWQNAQLPLTKT